MKNPRSKLLSIFAALAVALIAPRAVPAGNEGRKILEKADKAGWTEASHMLAEQTITTTGGSKRTFKIESWSKDGDDKQLMRYLAPPQSEGIGILTLDGGDNIWAYFPDSDDLRKIASSARNQSVQGSDFTYEDLATMTMSEKYDAKLLGEEEKLGHACYKLRLEPKPDYDSFYKKLVAWVVKSDYRPVMIRYYDKKGKHEKTLQLGSYKKVKGVWVARKLVMKNHQRGSKTTMKIMKVKINPELDDGMFTTRNLTII